MEWQGDLVGELGGRGVVKVRKLIDSGRWGKGHGDIGESRSCEMMRLVEVDVGECGIVEVVEVEVGE